MKIEKIRLQNFRCFGNQAVELNFEKVLTALVGGNGSGKTAVLQAVSRLFGTSPAERTVKRRDFHVLPDRQELQSGDSLYIEAILAFPELAEQNGTPLDAVPEFFNQMAASAQGEPLKARIRLQAIWTDDGTPEGAIEEDLRWIRALDDNFEWDDCSRVQAVERSSIQLIYLPANRDATTQVTALLKGRLWQAAKWSTAFRGASSENASQIQTDFEQEVPLRVLLRRLSQRWQQVHEADTDSQPRLRLIENRFEELVRKAEFTFAPDEEGQERRLSELSDGQRSLFHIALTAATLETEREAFTLPAEDSSFEHDKLRRVHLTILAIEEPENSLSPFFLSRIIAQAREVGGLSSAQVLISSHSPAILSRIEPEEVRYVRMDLGTKSSSIRKLTLPENGHEACVYVRLAVKAYPELYFARFVILGEGDSERIVIPKIAEEMGVPLDPSFVPIVPLGGRFVTHFWRLLNDLEIPHATLLDLDLGRRHGGAKVMSDCIQNLANVGNDFGNRNLINVATVTDQQIYNEGIQGAWCRAFGDEGIFFSYPLDLDFSMLRAFPTAYQVTNPGGQGPQSSASAIQNKKVSTLKSGGNLALYSEEYDDAFKWYPYLFLSRSKPETHLAAFSRITTGTLATSAPTELRALIQYVKDKLRLPGVDQ
ncbi:ATP-dependent endonuclease [Pseudidiomarina gelatinasegens]|uniref:ATP-dependent endonuclease n=1 Tax=Pseudidiomarina gelatinasegens TaxID=2487740 RepID=A0A443YYQ9_9GAMM|nr:AAA family ATPase [Pseudidiomarina gelatinasegens]RWU09265.1 ATP-dependent endonuclease [Pseudidiomarina gelatinasegens]